MKSKQKTTSILLGVFSALLLSGCAADQAATAVETANLASKAGVHTVACPLSDPNAARGAAIGTAAGARALLNPGAALATGVAVANSRANARRNEAAAAKVAGLAAHSDRIEHGMRNMLVVAYNRENRTHYRSYKEMRMGDFLKDYNKHFGTRFKSFKELLPDYNRRFHTKFSSTNALYHHLFETRE